MLGFPTVHTQTGIFWNSPCPLRLQKVPLPLLPPSPLAHPHLAAPEAQTRPGALPLRPSTAVWCLGRNWTPAGCTGPCWIRPPSVTPATPPCANLGGFPSCAPKQPSVPLSIHSSPSFCPSHHQPLRLLVSTSNTRPPACPHTPFALGLPKLFNSQAGSPKELPPLWAISPWRAGHLFYPPCTPGPREAPTGRPWSWVRTLASLLSNAARDSCRATRQHILETEALAGSP